MANKEWVVDKLAELTGIFAVRICAYAVLGNHFHLVVHIDSTHNWSDDEVVERYTRLFGRVADPRQQLPAPTTAASFLCLGVSTGSRCIVRAPTATRSKAAAGLPGPSAVAPDPRA